MMTDPISDMLTRIRNGFAAHKQEVRIPFSKVKFRLAQLMFEEKYVNEVKEVDDMGKPYISVSLKYTAQNLPAITTIKRISTPGRRIYKKKDELPVVLNGYGMAIVSTPEGMLSATEAKKRGLGGEIICEIS